MDSTDDSEIAAAPSNFAEGDPAAGDDLKRQMTACLRERFPDLKGIKITVIGKTAALRGEVRSIQEKHQCVEFCRHVPGIMRVVDDLTAAEEATIHFDPEEE